MRKYNLFLFITIIGVVHLAFAGGFRTQLSQPNRLSRSPVINWDAYRVRQQADSLDMGQSPLNKDFFKSALIPGWGQWSQGKKIRTGVFLGVEIAAITGAVIYQNKYSMKLADSHRHAKAHWDIQRWLSNYDPNTDPTTHTINFNYNGQEYKYPVQSEDNQLPASVDQNKNQWQMVWDREGYENAYKYDEFAGGWDTYNPSHPDNTTTGQYLNPSRLDNKHLRDTANHFADTSELFVYGVLVNHLIAAFDALIFRPDSDNQAAAQHIKVRMQPQFRGNAFVQTLQLEYQW